MGGVAAASCRRRSSTCCSCWSARPAALVTKEDILQALWPDVAVTDNAITQVVSDLRQALGDTPASPRVRADRAAPRLSLRRGAVETARRRCRARSRAPSVRRRARRRPSSGPRTIAVMDFTNSQREPSAELAAAGIAETMTNDLRAMRDLAVIDRRRCAEAGAPRVAGERDPTAAICSWSAACSAPAIGCASRRASWTSPRAQALAHAQGRRADGRRLSICRTRSSRSSRPACSSTMTPAAAARIRARETSSLDAYRALTEGRLKLETLDPTQVPARDRRLRARARARSAVCAGARRPGARALLAVSGLAGRAPAGRRRAGGGHRARAARGGDRSRSGRGALGAGVLPGVSAERPAEAVAAGRLAVALEPGNWRHQFRLGIAAWGDERLEALAVGRQRSFRRWRSRTSAARWCTSRAATSRSPRARPAARHQLRGRRGSERGALSGATACTGCVG